MVTLVNITNVGKHFEKGLVDCCSLVSVAHLCHQPEEDFQVQGKASVVNVIYPHQQYIFGDFSERLWAYLTIQQLLENRFVLLNSVGHLCWYLHQDLTVRNYADYIFLLRCCCHYYTINYFSPSSSLISQ